MEVDDIPFMIKEEKFDFDEEEERRDEPLESLTPRPRGRTRSLTKKSTDKVDIKAKLERSRQSARECRARKKLRYQYLEEIISETERSIFALRREVDMLRICAKELDEAEPGTCPDIVVQYRQSAENKKRINTADAAKRHEDLIVQQQQRFIKQQQQQQQLTLSPSSSSLGASGGFMSQLSPLIGTPPNLGGIRIGTPPVGSNQISTSPSGSLINNSFMAMALSGSPAGSHQYMPPQQQQPTHHSFSPNN